MGTTLWKNPVPCETQAHELKIMRQTFYRAVQPATVVVWHFYFSLKKILIDLLAVSYAIAMELGEKGIRRVHIAFFGSPMQLNQQISYVSYSVIIRIL